MNRVHKLMGALGRSPQGGAARIFPSVGKLHARAVVQRAMDETSIQVFHAGALIATVPRSTEKNICTRSSGEPRRRRGRPEIEPPQS